MKKLLIVVTAVMALVVASCKKPDNTPANTGYQWGQTLSSDTIPAILSGTLAAGKTYYLYASTVIPAGDTLVIQPGCTIWVEPSVSNPPSITVKGTLLSLGTQGSPIYISSFLKKETQAEAGSKDPAFTSTSRWLGINGDVSCNLMVFKWTHVDFTGAEFGATPPISALSPSSPSYAIFYQNADLKGQFILEDSWVYGSGVDAVRVQGGNINVMRNTFEKCGYTGGNAINVQGGTLGNIAYNVVIGAATNGINVSNANAPAGGPETNILVYNNTIVNCGYRQSPQTGEGGSINFEYGAEGQAWNNLLIDCRVGLRMNSGAAAPDITNVQYGYTYYYVDVDSTAGQIYPATYLTMPMATDIPTPTSYLYSGFTTGDTTGAVAESLAVSIMVSKYNPIFINYALPNYLPYFIDYVGNYSFRLQSTSPAIGKGTTVLGANPNPATITIDPNFGSSAITPIGGDPGAYQYNATGNQH